MGADPAGRPPLSCPPYRHGVRRSERPPFVRSQTGGLSPTAAGPGCRAPHPHAHQQGQDPGTGAATRSPSLSDPPSARAAPGPAPRGPLTGRPQRWLHRHRPPPAPGGPRPWGCDFACLNLDLISLRIPSVSCQVCLKLMEVISRPQRGCAAARAVAPSAGGSRVGGLRVMGLRVGAPTSGPRRGQRCLLPWRPWEGGRSAFGSSQATSPTDMPEGPCSGRLPAIA